MNPISIISRKRDGLELSTEEIQFFVRGYTDGDIPDYQAAAWLMAIFIRGMSPRETVDLTMGMANSGEILDLSNVLPFALDKHSSGGVGDKTSLVVLPLVASIGIPVAKMSGRGLDFSGGTLDKMESITGFNPNLSRAEFLSHAEKYGIVLAGQTGDLAPADGKLYALRDVTGTVPSTPLIASSIMSKKIASGADAIVLDVKVGLGAFMPTVDAARELAHLMVDIGTRLGKQMTALISDMNQPLGNAVGNALEVREAIDALHGHGPADFKEHCLMVAGHMARLAGKSQESDLSDILPQLEEKLGNGDAWKVFRTMVESQGGDIAQIDHPEMLPTAPVIHEVKAIESGTLSEVNAREIGLAALDLGAGRLKKGDPIDHSVGIVVHYKVGQEVETGAVLATIHARTEEAASLAATRTLEAHHYSSDARPLPIFYDVITSTGT